jgi:hypothetical protein
VAEDKGRGNRDDTAVPSENENKEDDDSTEKPADEEVNTSAPDSGEDEMDTQGDNAAANDDNIPHEDEGR